MYTPKYSSLPWRIEEIEMHENPKEKGIQIISFDGEIIADNQTYYPQPITLPNAKFICLAVNNLERLVEALKLAEWHLDQRHACHPDISPLRDIREALAAVEKEAKQ